MKKFLNFLEVNWFKLLIIVLLVIIASSLEELEDTQQAIYRSSSDAQSQIDY